MAFSHGRFRSGHQGGRLRQKFPRQNITSLPKPEASQARIQCITSASMLSDNCGEQMQIENIEYVASFSWRDTREPVILVPGKPPRWQPPSAVQSLPEDGGIYYRDPNSARFPSFPTEPAIRAICETVSGFDISEIDVFGCGNTIGSLLSFVSDEERSFRIGVEYIGSSLFLVRKTDKPGELLEDVRGYGHTFPEAYTQWDRSVKDSASHQRIIKYDFAGLKCFIRSETDGYLPNLVDESNRPPDELGDRQEDSSDVDQLLTLALGLQAPSGSNKLVLQHVGEVVPQRAIFDLKTRGLKSKRQDVSVESFLHRLWVNQTPNMILAYHTFGKFEPSDIHILDVRSKVADWETANATMLSKLGGLLHKLIEFAKQDGSLCFEIRRIGSGPLEIWSEVPQWSALPYDLKQQLGVSIPQVDTPSGNGAAEREKRDSEDEDADYLKF